MTQMNNITLSNVLPEVFVGREQQASDIWQKEVSFERGKKYLIEANSGTGKSSMCSFILGHRTDFRGNILFDGQDTHQLNIKDWSTIRRRNISMLWQDLRLFAELTAWENVQIKNRMTHSRSSKEIKEWFDLLGIAEKCDQPAGLLSFGQQQRVALIRMLCQPIDFAIVDEPVSHVDDSNGLLMSQLLQDEVKKQGAAIIVTSIGKRMEMDYDEILHL